jgi:MFS family permease
MSGGGVRYGRLALATVSGAVAVVVSQQIVLSLVVPQLVASLHASPGDLQWILDSYPIGLAALLLPFGAMGDRWGRRRMLLIGLVGMGAANIAIAMSDDVASVIVWRCVCAVGAALVFPATLSTLTSAFPAQRTRAITTWSIAAILGAFAGLFAAGAELEVFSWRSIFWSFGSLSLVLLVAVPLLVPESLASERINLDPLGSAVVVLGVGATAFGIVSAGEHGLRSMRVVGAVGVGLVLCAAFLRRQWLADHPLLDVRALARPVVGVGLVGTTSLFFAVYAAAFIEIEYLAITHGMSALQIGTTLLSYAPLLLPAIYWSGRVAKRVGAGPFVITGLFVVAATDLLYARLDADTTVLAFVGVAALAGGGMGLVQATATEAIMSALPDAEQGLASAVNDLTREFGAALGLAVSGSVLTSHLGTGGTPATVFMQAWQPTCIWLAGCAAACAIAVIPLYRRVVRNRPGGRHAGPRRPSARRRGNAPGSAGWDVARPVVAAAGDDRTDRPRRGAARNF